MKWAESVQRINIPTLLVRCLVGTVLVLGTPIEWSKRPQADWRQMRWIRTFLGMSSGRRSQWKSSHECLGNLQIQAISYLLRADLFWLSSTENCQIWLSPLWQPIAISQAHKETHETYVSCSANKTKRSRYKRFYEYYQIGMCHGYIACILKTL